MAEANVTELRVMSFNIRCGVAEDGPNGWTYRRDVAARTIAEFGPDVAGLQEAYTFQNRDLLERLPDYRMVGVARDDGVEDGEFCTILYKGLQPEESGTFWFSETPEVPGQGTWGAYHRRICTWARFDRFSMYNLHIDHESQESREKSIALLLSRLPNRPIVVTGDFNAGEDNPAVEAMGTAGFRDSFRVRQPDAPGASFHGYREVPEPDKIDYIWVSPHWDVRQSEIVRSRPEGQWPSDHFPVTAVLALT